MHTVGVAQPRRADLAVQQGVVDRVEHAIADTGHRRKQRQHRVAGAAGKAQRRQPDQGQPAHQYRARAEFVDDKTRKRLHRAGHDEKHR